MHRSDPSRLDDRALLRALAALVAQDRLTTAALLAHLAEVDARRLYLPAGSPSMHAYCVDALRFSEAAAFKRIQAARVTREFPVVLDAVTDGRLHLSAVCALDARLLPGNVGELVAAAASRNREQLTRWLAERFAPPRTALPLEAAGSLAVEADLATTGAQGSAPGRAENPAARLWKLFPGRVAPTPNWPSAPPKSLLRLAITARTRAKLARAQALLGHEAASGDLAQVVDRALDALIAQLERRRARAARADQASLSARPARASRTIPARVKREVWRRDHAQCSYVGLDGRHCAERKHLEFDHLDPVARGGRATTDRMRLLCRAHNQFEAERVYGLEFMRSKRNRDDVGPGP